MNYNILKYILLCVIFSVFPANANDIDSNKELQSLQKEIDRHEKQLSKKRKDERGTANLIASLDRKIDVTSTVLYKLRGQVQKDDSEIKRLKNDIEQLQVQIQQLRDIIKKRLVSFYKHGRRRDFQMLFAGGSLQTVDVWLRYEKLIAQNDKRNFESLISKKQKLESDQRQLQFTLAQREKTVSEQQRHAGQLKSSRSKRQTYLQNIRKDRRYLEQNLDELATAQEQIKGIISKSERLRVEKQRQISNQNIVPKPSRDYSFKTMKGRLPWPTSGSVISHFGRQRHPTLKTVTENLGIEIRASLGSPVQSIDAGMVETITWQRGRGNIVIISHDEGYYTVYTHLAEIRVNVMDTISAGQVIGTVGESGSLSGPVLHFQIWKNTENLNPEEWLS
jgi:murein hydrolase activator